MCSSPSWGLSAVAVKPAKLQLGKPHAARQATRTAGQGGSRVSAPLGLDAGQQHRYGGAVADLAGAGQLAEEDLASHAAFLGCASASARR